MVHKVEGTISTMGDSSISVVGTLKWDSIIKYNDKKYKVGYIVTKGFNSKNSETRKLAFEIEKDTKGEGLFIGFPLTFLIKDLEKEGLI